MIFGQLSMLLCARLAPPLRLAAPLPQKLTPTYTADYATVRTAVHTTAQTLTAQSLILLSQQPASPQSSSHSSVHHWLESTENMAPPPTPAESTLSIDRCELQAQQQALPLGADDTTLAPRTAATSRAASRSTRHSRRSATSSIAAKILGFSREMLGHFPVSYTHLTLPTTPYV